MADTRDAGVTPPVLGLRSVRLSMVSETQSVSIAKSNGVVQNVQRPAPNGA
jgi:hypothetical protein